MSRSFVRRELGRVFGLFVEADRRYLRSPRYVWLLASFPVLYLVLAAVTRLAGALLFTQEGPLIFLALGVPCWLSALAWWLKPTFAVRCVAALVVVLGEVLMGMSITFDWYRTTLPAGAGKGAGIGTLLVMMAVLGVQGLCGLLCVLLAVSGTAQQQQ